MPPGLFAQVRLVATAEIKEMVLSLRAFFLILSYGGLVGLTGLAVLKAQEFAEQKIAEAGGNNTGLTMSDAILRGIEEVFGQGLAQQASDAGLNGSAFLILVSTSFPLPILILLVGYNRISEDISSKFTRYLLQRVYRGSYLAGKLIGHWLVTWACIITAHLLVVGLGLAFGVPGIDEIPAVLPSVWAAMGLFSLVYCSLTAAFASFIQPPFLVLLVGTIMMGVFKVAAVILGRMYSEALGKLWIGAWDINLWLHDTNAILVHLAYAAGFIGLATFFLRSRDL